MLIDRGQGAEELYGVVGECLRAQLAGREPIMSFSTRLQLHEALHAAHTVIVDTEERVRALQAMKDQYGFTFDIVVSDIAASDHYEGVWSKPIVDHQ